MSIKKTRIWGFLSSIKLAIWLLAVIAALSLVGTLIPQGQDPAFYIDRYGHSVYKAMLETGLANVYTSFWFTLLLVIFSINLAVCILNRAVFKIRALGSLLSHVSILVILIGALIGLFFGQKGLIKIHEGEKVSTFADQNKREIDLGFLIKLDKFIYNEHIDPKEKLLVYPAGKGDSPVAEISAETGVELDIADTGSRIKVLRYVSDFAMDTATKTVVSRSARPNNPAIEVELKDKDGKTNQFWVFARFPDMHQKMGPAFKFVYHWAGRRPKDFISKVTIFKDGREVIKKDIRVNEPLHFGGYTLFQSSYDTEQLSWSGLQVAKDPGVGVVYAGFIMLTLGLVIIFYINPLIQSLPAGSQAKARPAGR